MPTETSFSHPSRVSGLLPGTLADLQDLLGGIPPERIRLVPPIGCATEEDVLWVESKEGRLCELEYGVLVEKPMGWYESLLASLVIGKLLNYLEANDLGQVLGESGSLNIMPGVVKIPDVSFISWSRFPSEKVPRRPIPSIVPDLAIEILSETNTQAEMKAKLARYFESGVCMVWYIDPGTRSAVSYTGTREQQSIGPDGYLDGGHVLPGFQLPLATLFEHADRQRPRRD
jgi:Uma2 family endonuclease